MARGTLLQTYCITFWSGFQSQVGFDKLAADLLLQKPLHNVPTIQWGIEHKEVAFQEYQKKLPNIHQDFTLQKAGFYVGDPAYLGASPDGVLVDKTGN